MCGIAGFIDFSDHSDTGTLTAMLDTLSHRGPDGEGIYEYQQLNFRVGLGHKRLSIIDLNISASQPFRYQSYVLVFNGEIYNYKEIRKELEEQNHQFYTQSDTEVILHAYEQWGEYCVQRFHGMYAMVLLDEAGNEVRIYRDRTGVKPLYYYFQDGLFLFASELKAFHQHPKFQKSLNPSALRAFLQYSYIPAPHTIFENTNKLDPGHFLHFKLENKTYQKIKYWDIYDAYSKPKIQISESEAIEETERILKKAFDYRMVADVPVGVFLSGGYDSSAVAAILQRDRMEKIKTFTIGFHESKYNEAPFASEVAKHLGTNHTEYYCTTDDARGILEYLPYYYDEPFGDSSAIPTILVSRLARKDVTVSLSADGGDEVFGGYNRYPIIQNMDNRLKRVPKAVRNALYQTSGWINPETIPVLKEKKLIGQRYSKFRKLLRESNATNYLKSMSSVIDDATLDNVLNLKSKNLSTYFDEDDSHIHDILDKVLAKDVKTYMVDDILTKVDRATMSVALEGREPFLDQNIMEWVAQLPGDLKIRNGNKKYLLKQIVHRYIPKAMMDRPKAGFAIPIELWFQKELSEYFEIYFDQKYIEAQGIFRYEELNKWLMRYRMGYKEYMTQLWNVLMFQLWYERWMK